MRVFYGSVVSFLIGGVEERSSEGGRSGVLYHMENMSTDMLFVSTDTLFVSTDTLHYGITSTLLPTLYSKPQLSRKIVPQNYIHIFNTIA